MAGLLVSMPGVSCASLDGNAAVIMQPGMQFRVRRERRQDHHQQGRQGSGQLLVAGRPVVAELELHDAETYWAEPDEADDAALNPFFKRRPLPTKTGRAYNGGQTTAGLIAGKFECLSIRVPSWQKRISSTRLHSGFSAVERESRARAARRTGLRHGFAGQAPG